MNNLELQSELKNFVQVCDNMIDSKFVLIDKRIGDILSVIAKSRFVYNIIAEHILGYNFERDFNNATKAVDVFIMPKENYIIVPFVFTLLNKLNEKKINILHLLKNNFTSDNEYKLFVEKVIVPFKTSVLAMLEDDSKDISISFNNNTVVLSKELASRIQYLIKEFCERFNLQKWNKSQEKNICKFMVDNIINALHVQDENMSYALYLGFKYFISSVSRKDLKLLTEIDELFNLFKKV